MPKEKEPEVKHIRYRCERHGWNCVPNWDDHHRCNQELYREFPLLEQVPTFLHTPCCMCKGKMKLVPMQDDERNVGYRRY